MARMSIDDKFLRDARVVLLGRRFGWSRRETMGALLDVFALTYDQETDVISGDEIDVAADQAGFAIAMIEVDLGEQDAVGVRIKGAAERIEYLASKREAGRKGGRKSGESRRNKNEAKRSTASSDREAFGNPPDPVPDLSPDPVPVPEDQKLTLPRDPAALPGTAPQTPQPPDATEPSTWDFVTGSQVAPVPCTHAAQELADRRRALFWRSWQLAGEAFSRVRAAGIDSAAPNGWAGLPDAGSPPAKNLRAIIDGMLVGEQPDFVAAEARIANRIAVSEAKARATSDGRYMSPSGMWNRDWFAIDADMSPEQATRPRAGPKSSAARAPASQPMIRPKYAEPDENS